MDAGFLPRGVATPGRRGSGSGFASGAELLPRCPARRWPGSPTPRPGTAAAMRAWMMTGRPGAARERREQAQRDARVQLWREVTGTAALYGSGLPPEEALAAGQLISGRALQLKATGLAGTMNQLRARAYLDMLLGQDSSPVLASPDSPARPGPGAPGPAEPGSRRSRARDGPARPAGQRARRPAAGRCASRPAAGGRRTRRGRRPPEPRPGRLMAVTTQAAAVSGQAGAAVTGPVPAPPPRPAWPHRST